MPASMARTVATIGTTPTRRRGTVDVTDGWGDGSGGGGAATGATTALAGALAGAAFFLAVALVGAFLAVGAICAIYGSAATQRGTFLLVPMVRRVLPAQPFAT